MLSKTVTSCVFTAALACCGAALAQFPDLPHLHSVAQAEQERDDSRLAQQVLERDYAQAQRECLSRFFVARCQTKARDAYNETMAQESLKQRQAELYLRRIASAERAQQREQAGLAREAEKKRIIQQAEQAPTQQALPPRSAVPAPDLAPLPLPALTALPDPRQADPRPSDSSLTDAQRAANIDAYERRQQEAADHAARVEEKRLEAELRRAQRREEREALAERLKALQQERGAQ